MSLSSELSRMLTRLDPRKWSLAGQMALSSGALVATILALLAWGVTRSAQPLVVEKAGGTFQAAAGGLNDVILLYIGDRVREVYSLGGSEVIRSTLQRHNANYAGDADRIISEIQALDRQWVAAADSDPLIAKVTDTSANPAAAELADFMGGFPEHSEVFITDRYGATAAATGRLTDFYQADESWWQAAWNQGRGAVYLSQPIYDESAGVIAVQVASSVTDASGQPIGVIRSTLAVDQLFALVAEAAAGRSYEVLVIDSSGLGLFDSAVANGVLDVGIAFTGFPRGLGPDSDGYGQLEDIHGTASIIGYSVLRTQSARALDLYDAELVAAVNDLGWTTIVYRDRPSLFEPVTDYVRLMVWVTIGSVAVFGLGSFIIGRSITSPLRTFTTASKRISDGEFGYHIPVRGNQEVARLSEAFNRMSRQVEFSLQVLRSEVEERKQAQEAAQESGIRLRSTLDTMMEGAQIIGSDWQYLYVNDAVAKQGRQTKETLIGRTMMEMYPGIEQTEMFHALEHCMQRGESTIMQNEFTFPDGSIGWFDLSIQRVPEGVFILSSDVTQRKKAEDDLRQLNKQLERRVRERTAELEAANQELEAFAYSVSHDLRAPLRSIDGFTQALVEDCGDQLDHQARGYTDRVRAAAQRMGMLIDDLLKLSRVTRGEMQRRTVDLSAIADEVIESLRELEPDRSVEVQVEQGLKGKGDQRLLRVALENLLGNAWKFTANRAQPSIVFGRTNANGSPAFFVRDNGTGFDMQYANKLFGAFQRLHSEEEFPGTGVGLATVQRVIRRHGGRVWAEAKVEGGATFYFTLQDNGGRPNG